MCIDSSVSIPLTLKLKMKNAKMGPNRASSSISIGNCEVMIEACKFICKSDPDSLQISVLGDGRVTVSAREKMNADCRDDYSFVLLNPKSVDACTTSSIREVLELYKMELPAMKYAANTGKQSMFLERSVSNGKYCTLVLKAKPRGASEMIIAAITYQIVPADTQFAEIPLAAVASTYQKKGFGRILYEELRRRLQSVGIRSIVCWGDQESGGFWIKQGFTSIAEVNKKGRLPKLPVKADVRKALCFPGGSTFMISYLSEDSTVDLSNLNSCSQTKLQEPSQFIINTFKNPEAPQVCNKRVKPLHQTNSTETTEPSISLRRGLSGEDMDIANYACQGSMHVYRESAPSERVEYNNKAIDGEEVGAATSSEPYSSSGQGVKRRVWESSISSLKSKKVKGTHVSDCQVGSDCMLATGIQKNQGEGYSSPPTLAADPTFMCSRGILSEEKHMDVMPFESLKSGEHYRITLMNIADDDKKACLKKVIENLGGALTSDGSVSSHVVTGKVRRTLNFCTTLCSGAWIVSPVWLKESFREGRFTAEYCYILNDEDYHSKYGTQLKNAVLRAKARPGALLRGYDICIAAHVQPDVKTFSTIVRSAGGNVILGLENITETSSTIYIASEKDTEEAVLAARKGAWTFDSEWLMNCVMKQEVDLEAPQFAESL